MSERWHKRQDKSRIYNKPIISITQREKRRNRNEAILVEYAYVLPRWLRRWQETQVREEPLEEGTVTHSSILVWRIPMDRGAWWATVQGVAESDMAEQLSTHVYILPACVHVYE